MNLRKLRVHSRGCSPIAAHFSLSLLSRDKLATGVLITDLTARKEQVDLASRFQRMQDDERKRIARELHDSVGQLLAAPIIPTVWDLAAESLEIPRA